jgi:hypothetical protein
VQVVHGDEIKNDRWRPVDNNGAIKFHDPSCSFIVGPIIAV